MGLIERVRSIIKANINDLVARAENPAKTLDRLIDSMETDFSQVKTEVLDAVRDEKLLERQLEAQVGEVQLWDRRSVLAVEKDDDELAREAIRRRRRAQELTDTFRVQLETQRAAVDSLRRNLGELEQKLVEAKARKSMLLAQQRRAEIQKSVGKVMSSHGVAGSRDAFEQAADRIQDLELKADAYQEMYQESMEKRFRDLEKGFDVDEELRLLKERVSKDKGNEPVEKPLRPEEGPPSSSEEKE
ncbi:MAG: PspA/IM30 family protein [Verrucomicrobia bacterium]|nr:PspA/IM30 family protein [Verrucomicrobiota bacterium]